MKLREFDKPAVFSILVRQIEAQERKAEAEKTMAAAKEQLDAAAAIISNIRPALSVFGFDTTAPKLWDVVKEALGAETYHRAFRVARDALVESKKSESDEEEDFSEDGEGSTSSAEIDGEADTPKVREMILDRLKLAGGGGAKVAELKAFIASQGVETHEKTAGMTLYRLSKEGLVRRDRRTWIYVGHIESGKDESSESSAANGISLDDELKKLL